MSGDDKRTWAERAAEAFARTVSPPADVRMEAVEPATLARLEEAVRSLRRLDREVFLAHRLDAMSYDEIARRTGLSVNQVEWAMCRALRGIGRHLRGEPRHRFWWIF